MKNWICLFSVIFLAGCAPVTAPATPGSTDTRPAQITPYHTPTPLRSATPAPNQPTPTALPTWTPTPRIHVVKTGEDMSGIALRYRVSLDAIKTANPSANPRIIIVGQQIIIPAGTPFPGTIVPTATAVKIIIDPPQCLNDESGGVWCFTIVKNLKLEPVESVTVRIRLLDDKEKQVAAQVASTSLNLLQAGKALPVMAYFSAPVPRQFRAAAELVNTLPVLNLAARYLTVAVENQRVQVAPDQKSAEISGMLALVKTPPIAKQVAVVAAAYAEDGRLVGLRRWESMTELGASPMPFSMKVYAVGEKISRVEILAEARP